jgi:hypothetical protein
MRTLALCDHKPHNSLHYEVYHGLWTSGILHDLESGIVRVEGQSSTLVASIAKSQNKVMQFKELLKDALADAQLPDIDR